MAKPWAQRAKWPYVAKSGRKSYGVGFYDHRRRQSTRTFPTIRHARAWMDDYITAERRGRDSLRRFLLDLDAKEANQAEESRSLAEVLELYLSVSGHPSNQGGLAPATYERYRSTIGMHLTGKPRALTPGGRPPPGERYAVELGKLPARDFNAPQAPRGWRERMVREGVTKSTRDHAWHVLSAALSWASASQLVPEIQTNGCSLATEPRVNRRRSVRVGGTGEAPNPRKHGLGVASWALSPRAVEAIRQDMLARTSHRDHILAQRDATIVSLQYGLAARNQEIWALRWRSIADEYMWVQEVLSHGTLDEWGKTEDSVQRRALMPAILREDLTHWRGALQAWGHPARAHDFIIPGDLASPHYGTREPHTGACHLTANQAKAWGSKYFTPAVQHVAAQPEFMPILGATPYSLRRGGISLRLRAEDPQTVASECGTSLKMLSNHYAYAIQDLRRNGPRSADVEWQEARTATQAVVSEQQDRDGAPNRRRLLTWLSARGRASGGS